LINNITHRSLIAIIFLLVIILSLSSCKTSEKGGKFIKQTKVAKKQQSNKIGNKPTKSNNVYTDLSNKLGVDLKGDEDIALITEIAKWLNTPYKYGGNDKAGVDCSGFTMTVYQNVYKIKLYRSSIDQLKNATFIDKADLKAGDLLFFITYGKNVSHVGIYISKNKFIHASSIKGVVINDLNDEYYKKTFYKAGRVKKIGS